MEELAKWLSGILDECLARKMQLPFIACSAAPNGSVVAVRYTESTSDGMDCEVLAEHIEDGAFKLPINYMIVGGRQRDKTAYNSVSSLRTVAKLETYDGLDRSNFIFQSVCPALQWPACEISLRPRDAS
jgi:hypothetical protein